MFCVYHGHTSVFLCCVGEGRGIWGGRVLGGESKREGGAGGLKFPLLCPFTLSTCPSSLAPTSWCFYYCKLSYNLPYVHLFQLLNAVGVPFLPFFYHISFHRVPSHLLVGFTPLPSLLG